MMMREQQWDRSNCRRFRIDVCLHQRIYMRAFVNARNKKLRFAGVYLFLLFLIKTIDCGYSLSTALSRRF